MGVLLRSFDYPFLIPVKPVYVPRGIVSEYRIVFENAMCVSVSITYILETGFTTRLWKGNQQELKTTTTLQMEVVVI